MYNLGSLDHVQSTDLYMYLGNYAIPWAAASIRSVSDVSQRYRCILTLNWVRGKSHLQ